MQRETSKILVLETIKTGNNWKYRINISLQQIKFGGLYEENKVSTLESDIELTENKSR